jgi:Uma2 family endonuclease
VSHSAWYNSVTMTQITATIIGPADHGRRMSLDEFDTAIGREGKLYELSRGVIVVSDVPNPPHGDVLFAAREQFSTYRRATPGAIHRIYGGAECKLLIEGTESERHPDIAVYKHPSPGDDSSVWSIWVPEIVIEVVSADSADRDYQEKPEDYLQFGVKEYWVIDPLKQVVVIHRRVRGRWKLQTLTAGQKYTTPWLPGFEFDVAAALQP